MTHPRTALCILTNGKAGETEIGIALGSGAARGWTQIGILEGLGALGIVPETVSGASIGALVGAAFATGKLAALRERIQNFRRRDVAAMLDVKLAAGPGAVIP